MDKRKEVFIFVTEPEREEDGIMINVYDLLMLKKEVRESKNAIENEELDDPRRRDSNLRA
jgi:hypothetical protein